MITEQIFSKAKKLSEDYMTHLDLDKDGKLSRSEAEVLMTHIWDVSQRCQSMHVTLKDSIKDKEIKSNEQVYKWLFNHFAEADASELTPADLEA